MGEEADRQLDDCMASDWIGEDSYAETRERERHTMALKILDTVTAAHEADEDHLKILLWGDNGVGKSTICGTCPGKVLYLYTERQGLLSFKRMAPSSMVLKIESLADLRNVLRDLKSGQHDFDSVCLDSFTEMQQLIADEITAGKSDTGTSPLISQKEYGVIHDRSKGLIRAFRDLPMHVVMTMLSETTTIGEGEQAKLVTRVMLIGRKLPGQIGQFFNLIGFAYKASDKQGMTKHKVLFDGRADISVKGMPGLRYREEPNVDLWHRVAILGEERPDPDAKMIQDVSRCWEDEPAAKEKKEPEEKPKKAASKKKAAAD